MVAKTLLGRGRRILARVVFVPPGRSGSETERTAPKTFRRGSLLHAAATADEITSSAVCDLLLFSFVKYKW